MEKVNDVDEAKEKARVARATHAPTAVHSGIVQRTARQGPAMHRRIHTGAKAEEKGKAAKDTTHVKATVVEKAKVVARVSDLATAKVTANTFRTHRP